MTIRLSNFKWLVLSVVVIILDQYTKWLAVTKLSFAKPVVIIPHFANFTLLFNTGAAFSFLAASGGWQRWLFSFLAIAIVAALIIWLVRLTAQQSWVAFAISLVVGGALGNLIDRIRLSYVIDFIDLYYKGYHWPAFNVADSAVVVGAIILGIYFLKHE